MDYSSSPCTQSVCILVTPHQILSDIDIRDIDIRDIGSCLGVASDGKVDRNTWKTIQLIMQDSQKFCEMMNGHDWSHGVSDDILRTVISFFAPGEEFPVSEREDGNVKVQGRVQGNVVNPKEYTAFSSIFLCFRCRMPSFLDPLHLERFYIAHRTHMNHRVSKGSILGIISYTMQPCRLIIKVQRKMALALPQERIYPSRYIFWEKWMFSTTKLPAFEISMINSSPGKNYYRLLTNYLCT